MKQFDLQGNEYDVQIKDMIEPIPNWEYTYVYEGSRTCGKSYIQNLLDKKDKEIERLHSIIKEAREKLNTQLAFTSSYQLNYQSAMSIIEETKSILDKENI